MTFRHSPNFPAALVCLDRDGTLMVDTGYVRDPAEVTLLPGAAEAVAALAARGVATAIVSNQSGLARGLITGEEWAAVHRAFSRQLFDASGVTPPAFYCVHGPDDGCDCRKPRPGMLLEASRKLAPGAPGAMVGDKPSDLEAGRAAGFASFLYGGDWGATLAELKAWLAEVTVRSEGGAR